MTTAPFTDAVGGLVAHTPGPHAICGDGELECFILRGNGGKGPDIAHLYCDQEGSEWTAEQTANARLYAAASELLTAAKFAREQFQHTAPDDCYSTGPRTGDAVLDSIVCPGCVTVKRLDSAIAKAEGRTC